MIASNDLDKSKQNIYTYIRSRPYALRIYSMYIITLCLNNNSHKIVYKNYKLKIKYFKALVTFKRTFSKILYLERQYYAGLSYRLSL